MDDLERVELAARRISSDTLAYANPGNPRDGRWCVGQAFREFADEIKTMRESPETSPETSGIPKLPPKPICPETTPVTGLRGTETNQESDHE